MMQPDFNWFFAVVVAAAFSFSSCQKEIYTDNAPTPEQPATGRLPQSVTVGNIALLPTELEESSGLCFTDGAMWTFGDSGNPNAIYKIDTATGAVLQKVTISNYLNIDWEDIAADADYLYIGDVGNNLGFRKDLKILRLKKSDITQGAATLSVTAEAIQFTYTDQDDYTISNSTNFNSEAIISAGDSLYLFSKNGSDLQTRCYAISKRPGTYQVAPISSFNTEGRVTAAAYYPETKELALLGYLPNTRASFIWFFDGFSGSDFFGGEARKFTIGTATTDWQTEALEFVSPDRLMMSCEKSASNEAALYFVQKVY